MWLEARKKLKASIDNKKSLRQMIKIDQITCPEAQLFKQIIFISRGKCLKYISHNKNKGLMNFIVSVNKGYFDFSSCI